LARRSFSARWNSTLKAGHSASTSSSLAGGRMAQIAPGA
jgi:hypothetical protein